MSNGVVVFTCVYCISCIHRFRSSRNNFKHILRKKQWFIKANNKNNTKKTHPKKMIKAYISQASLAATIASKLKFSRSWGQRNLFEKKIPMGHLKATYAAEWMDPLPSSDSIRSHATGLVKLGPCLKFSSTTFLFTSASNQVLACGNLMWMNLSGETVKPSFARPTSRRQRCSRLLQ